MTTMTQKAQDGGQDASSDPALAASPGSRAAGEARGRGKAPSAFRTISEVADELDVPQHVLRFWETKFSQVKPLKRGGGRRYYRPEDVTLLKKIHHLLYTEGYTIKGVQKLLRGPVAKASLDAVVARPVADIVSAPAAPQASAQAQVPQAAAPEAVVVSAKPAPSVSAPLAAAQAVPGLSSKQKAILESMLGELKDLRNMIRSSRDDG